MKRNFLALMLVFVVASPTAFGSGVHEDLSYLGYSDEIILEAMSSINRSQTVRQAPPSKIPADTGMSEADAVLEQLTELGRTRRLTPDHSIGSFEVRDRLDIFWDGLRPPTDADQQMLSSEFKEYLKERITNALNNEGYLVTQFDLIDVPARFDVPQVRAVIRVVRPLKTKYSYREIQDNLREVKAICSEAGVVNGVNYLSELTTFLAENPRSKHYYERTILTP